MPQLLNHSNAHMDVNMFYAAYCGTLGHRERSSWWRYYYQTWEIGKGSQLQVLYLRWLRVILFHTWDVFLVSLIDSILQLQKVFRCIITRRESFRPLSQHGSNGRKLWQNRHGSCKRQYNYRVFHAHFNYERARIIRREPRQLFRPLLWGSQSITSTRI